MSEEKKQYPDEVVDGIIEKTKILADKIPAETFLGMTPVQIRQYWESVQNLMLIGADVALDYMDNKLNKQ